MLRRPFSHGLNGFSPVAVTMSPFLKPNAELWRWLIGIFQAGNA